MILKNRGLQGDIFPQECVFSAMPDVIGWISSAILLITIVQQIRTQVREGSSRGVSIWLFIGEIAAASGFLLYSILLGLIVYEVTNSIMIISSITGLAITVHHRRSGAS